MKYQLALVLATIIWGSAFIAQVLGMDYVGPYTFNGVRFVLGSMSLLPLLYFSKPERHERKTHIPFWAAVLIVGLPLVYSSTLQQVALQHVSVAKTSFLGSTYMIMVPFAGLLIGFALRITHIIGTLIAIAGVYFLTMSGTIFQMDPWDLAMITVAIGFTIQIIALTVMTRYYSPLSLSCGSFFLTGILNLILAFIFEEPEIASILKAAPAILYTAIFSTGIAYTLQAVGLKHVPPTEASMLLSLEMIFGALAGILFLGERLSFVQTIGAFAEILGVFITQIPGKIIFKPFRNKEEL